MLNLCPTDLESYCLSKSSVPPPPCDEIECYTQKNEEASHMLIGPLEASFLCFLIRSLEARCVLEIGTFTGYSALAMASSLPHNGKVTTLEISPERAAAAQSFWAKSEHGKKITLLLGPARESLKTLEDSFDLVFIDADKENILHYFTRSLEILSPRGIILVDNCLWSGRVLEVGDTDSETRAIKDLNDFVAKSPTLTTCLLPIRDGLLLVRPRG